MDKKYFYKLVSNIPKGRVTTYSIIAKQIGMKNPRQVGNILHNNPDPKNIPCHRVVNIRGGVSDNFAFGGAFGQTDKLENEGIKVKEGKVNLNKFLWGTKVLSIQTRGFRSCLIKAGTSSGP